MMVKVIAVERIHRTEVGGELEVQPTVAEALVRLGRARYAEGHVPKPAALARVSRARRNSRGAVGATSTRNVTNS